MSGPFYIAFALDFAQIDDLTEQLQTRIDQHSQALLEAEKYQREAQDKDLSIKELKTIIQQLEQDLLDKSTELESTKEVKFLLPRLIWSLQIGKYLWWFYFH